MAEVPHLERDIHTYVPPRYCLLLYQPNLQTWGVAGSIVMYGGRSLGRRS